MSDFWNNIIDRGNIRINANGGNIFSQIALMAYQKQNQNGGAPSALDSRAVASASKTQKFKDGVGSRGASVGMRRGSSRLMGS